MPVDVPFPQSSQPGFQPGEGAGRLLNRYFETDGALSQWKLCPGLLPYGDTGYPGPRGQLDVNGTLYIARNNTAVTMLPGGGSVTVIPNALPGTDAVFWAKNNRVGDSSTPPSGYPGPNVVACCQAGTYLVESSGVIPYPDPSLPAANSVAMLDGYLLFTVADGHVYASGLNDIWVSDSDHTQNALAFAMCDMSGGLLRGTAWAEQFFAFGKKAITVFVNSGAYPFPLARTSIIPVGLKGASCVTGFEPGWGLAQYFIANDNTVRRLDGYVATVVSNRDVERAIAAVSDVTTLEMSCYVAGGRPAVVVSGPNFTWEHNALSNNWNERQSPNLSRWRSSKSVFFAGQWLYGDTQGTGINMLSATTYSELGASFLARLESGPVKQYPSRIRCTAVYLDFTSGQGQPGTDDSTDPSVMISTSLDGGGNWSNPIVRRDLGRQGEFNKMIRVNRIGGIASHHGIRFRVDSSSPIYSSCRGGRVDLQILGAP